MREQVIGIIAGLAVATNYQSCSWEGHCLGDACSTYDDCADDMICFKGKCAPPRNLGDPCIDENDCLGEMICVQSKCANAPAYGSDENSEPEFNSYGEKEIVSPQIQSEAYVAAEVPSTTSCTTTQLAPIITTAAPAYSEISPVTVTKPSPTSTACTTETTFIRISPQVATTTSTLNCAETSIAITEFGYSEFTATKSNPQITSLSQFSTAANLAHSYRLDDSIKEELDSEPSSAKATILSLMAFFMIFFAF